MLEYILTTLFRKLRKILRNQKFTEDQLRDLSDQITEQGKFIMLSVNEDLLALKTELQAGQIEQAASIKEIADATENIAADLTRVLDKLANQSVDSATLAELSTVVKAQTDLSAALKAKAAAVTAVANVIPEPVVVPPVDPPVVVIPTEPNPDTPPADQVVS